MKFHALLACALLLATQAVASPTTTSPAPANCALRQLATLPLSTASNGMLTVPVKVGDTSEQFVLAFGQPYTTVSAALVNDRQLVARRFGSWWTPAFVTELGQAAGEQADIPQLSAGHAVMRNVHALVMENPAATGASGALAMDFLSAVDVELDLGAARMNLFSPDHCPGNVVYWGRSYTVLPLTRGADGPASFQVQLDGKPIRTRFGTMANGAELRGSTANSLFGISPPRPILAPRKKQRLLDAYLHPQVATYSLGKDAIHTFGNLVFQGVAFRNLQVTVLPETNVQPCHGERIPMAGAVRRCYGGVDLLLGRHEMKALRLYFAFHENALYVTGADPAPARAAPSSSQITQTRLEGKP